MLSPEMWEFIYYSSSFDSNYYMCITIHLGYSNHQQMGDNTLWFSLVAQSWCPALCDPIDCGPPGSSVHGISQARMLEWVAISYSNV